MPRKSFLSLEERCQRDAARVATWQRAHPAERSRASRKHTLKRKFGLTPDAVAMMKKAQAGRCALCGTDKPGGRGDFHIDHNHKTGKVRALLCYRCNTRLGIVEDADFLAKALAYLETHR